MRLIGRNIREARLKADLTQECLAELTGVHVQTIGVIERGSFPFAVTTFVRLSQFLETSPNRLVDGLNPPDRRRTERIRKAMARKRAPAGSQRMTLVIFRRDSVTSEGGRRFHIATFGPAVEARKSVIGSGLHNPSFGAVA